MKTKDIKLVSLIRSIYKADKSTGILSSILNNKTILLSMTMFFLMLGTAVTIYLTGNQFLLSVGMIITGISIFLNAFNGFQNFNRENQNK